MSKISMKNEFVQIKRLCIKSSDILYVEVFFKWFGIEHDIYFTSESEILYFHKCEARVKLFYKILSHDSLSH